MLTFFHPWADTRYRCDMFSRQYAPSLKLHSNLKAYSPPLGIMLEVGTTVWYPRRLLVSTHLDPYPPYSLSSVGLPERGRRTLLMSARTSRAYIFFRRIEPRMSTLLPVCSSNWETQPTRIYIIPYFADNYCEATSMLPVSHDNATTRYFDIVVFLSRII